MISKFEELLVYKKAFKQSMDIFTITKSFPKEERYSLTDQIRRSSRSVCANIAEAYHKRLYKKHFILGLSHSDAENAETLNWLSFAYSCEYISKDQLKILRKSNLEVGRMLGYMMKHPEKFL